MTEEERRKYMQEYRQAHKDEMNAARARWYARTKEKNLKRRRQTGADGENVPICREDCFNCRFADCVKTDAFSSKPDKVAHELIRQAQTAQDI